MSSVQVDTMIFHGKPVSMKSEIGTLALLHGALQSAIGSVDDALKAECAYRDAVADLVAAH
jgi:hypothetical protein